MPTMTNLVCKACTDAGGDWTNPSNGTNTATTYATYSATGSYSSNLQPYFSTLLGIAIVPANATVIASGLVVSCKVSGASPSFTVKVNGTVCSASPITNTTAATTLLVDSTSAPTNILGLTVAKINDGGLAGDFTISVTDPTPTNIFSINNIRLWVRYTLPNQLGSITVAIPAIASYVYGEFNPEDADYTIVSETINSVARLTPRVNFIRSAYVTNAESGTGWAAVTSGGSAMDQANPTYRPILLNPGVKDATESATFPNVTLNPFPFPILAVNEKASFDPGSDVIEAFLVRKNDSALGSTTAFGAISTFDTTGGMSIVYVGSLGTLSPIWGGAQSFKASALIVYNATGGSNAMNAGTGSYWDTVTDGTSYHGSGLITTNDGLDKRATTFKMPTTHSVLAWQIPALSGGTAAITFWRNSEKSATTSSLQSWGNRTAMRFFGDRDGGNGPRLYGQCCVPPLILKGAVSDALHQQIAAYYQAKFVLHVYSDAASTVVVWQGDSISVGGYVNGATGVRPTMIRALPKGQYEGYNFSTGYKTAVYPNEYNSGAAWNSGYMDAPTSVDLAWTGKTGAKTKLLFIALGSNDMAYHSPGGSNNTAVDDIWNGAGTVTNGFSAYLDARRAAAPAGTKIIVVVEPARGTVGTTPSVTNYKLRAARLVNTYLLASLGTKIDAVVDCTNDANLQTTSNTTYFYSDSTHLVDAGEDEWASLVTSIAAQYFASGGDMIRARVIRGRTAGVR